MRNGRGALISEAGYREPVGRGGRRGGQGNPRRGDSGADGAGEPTVWGGATGGSHWRGAQARAEWGPDGGGGRGRRHEGKHNKHTRGDGTPNKTVKNGSQKKNENKNKKKKKRKKKHKKNQRGQSKGGEKSQKKGKGGNKQRRKKKKKKKGEGRKRGIKGGENRGGVKGKE